MASLTLKFNRNLTLALTAQYSQEDIDEGEIHIISLLNLYNKCSKCDILGMLCINKEVII